MSKTFSNASTGDKPADPYKKENLETDVTIAQKVDDLSKFISSCKFGMMTTRDASSGRLVSRCMALAAQETGGIDLLFHTNTESGKTDDLAGDPHTNIAFLDSAGEWASLSGKASIITDRATVKKHYTSTLKAWLGDLGDGKHDGSENDPRIGIIKVETETATYCLTGKNLASRVADMAQGALTGNVATPNKLREISDSEIKTWRASH